MEALYRIESPPPSAKERYFEGWRRQRDSVSAEDDPERQGAFDPVFTALDCFCADPSLRDESDITERVPGYFHFFTVGTVSLTLLAAFAVMLPALHDRELRWPALLRAMPSLATAGLLLFGGAGVAAGYMAVPRRVIESAMAARRRPSGRASSRSSPSAVP